MIIPRGGAALHRLCREQATIPVITGGMGICHIFVDASADLARAVDIVENAKVQRPSVCNALDTVLVHRAVADRVSAGHGRAAGAERRRAAGRRPMRWPSCKPRARRRKVVPAGPDDFDTEWMALILGVKIVDTLDEAIAHIQEHSTEHSDSILTNDWANANRFVNEINSSAVFVNASTRFNDGGQFGLGAEVAVSTQKLHARGPDGAGGADDLQVGVRRRWACASIEGKMGDRANYVIINETDRGLTASILKELVKTWIMDENHYEASLAAPDVLYP